MIPISLLAASNYTYSQTKLPYDQYIDKTKISNKILFLYDNSIALPNLTENERHSDGSDILRWQVDKYKNGSKPGEVSEDIYVKNVPLRLNNIAGHLVES